MGGGGVAERQAGSSDSSNVHLQFFAVLAHTIADGGAGQQGMQLTVSCVQGTTACDGEGLFLWCFYKGRGGGARSRDNTTWEHLGEFGDR